MIYIPAESFHIAHALPEDMYDVETMSTWMGLPLMTAERVMHLVWPDQTRGFGIKGDKRSLGVIREDDDIYRAYYWNKCRGVDQDDIQQPKCKLVIASLVPWALSPMDLADFMRVPEVIYAASTQVVSCTAINISGQFPAFTIDHGTGTVNNPPGYTRAHKIWAKVRWLVLSC